MTGTIKKITPNYSFRIPIFDAPGWGREIERNFDIIDSVMLAISGFTNIRGVWTNATDYVVGDRVVDETLYTIFQCAVSHTSSATGSFLDDRTANPTYWEVVSTTTTNRGNWVTATTYNVNDFIVDPIDHRWGIATQQFTSQASYQEDVDDGFIVVLIDLGPFYDAIELAKNDAETAATTATTQAGIATTQAGNATTQAGLAATSAANALTSENNAETAETNAETAQALAEAAQIAAEAARDAAILAQTGAETAETNAETAETNAETAEANAVNAQVAAEAAQTAAELAQALAEAAAAQTQVLGGHIYGCILRNNTTDATNDINITTGTCASNDTIPTLIKLESLITKRLDAAWAEGNNQGGRDTGSIANGTWHVFLIFNPTSVVTDALFSQSPSAPTLPSGYTKYRRIGSIIRSGGVILPFRQYGNDFSIDAVTDRNNTAAQANTLLTLTVPTGIVVAPKILIVLTLNAANNNVTIGLGDGQAADTQNVVHAVTGANDSSVTARDYFNGAFWTNASAQIRFSQTNTAGTPSASAVTTSGWTDMRGQYGSA